MNIDFQSFVDTINSEYNRIYQRFKLPPHGFQWFLHRTEISYIDPEQLVNRINTVLFDIEGIRGEYNTKKFCWELEWGTKPMKYTVEGNKIKRVIELKHRNAIYASFEACKKFPHNVEQDDNEIEFIDTKRWCKFQIFLSYCEESNKIIIEYNLEAGHALSFYYITKIIKSHFDNH